MKNNKVFNIIKSDKRNLCYLAVHMFATIMVSLIGVYVVQLAKEIVDNGVSMSDQIGKYIMIALGLIIGGTLFSYCETYFSALFCTNTVQTLRNKLVGKILNLEYGYFDNVHSGTILNKVNGDVDLIQDNLENTVPQLITAVFKFASAFIYLAFINLKLVMCCVVLTIIVFVFVKVVITPISKIFDKHQKKLDEAMAVAQESISGVYMQKAYNLQEEFTRQFDEKIDEVTRQALKRQKLMAITFPLTDILKFLPTLVCMVLGFINTYQGEITSGSFVAFVMLLGKLTEPMAEFPVLIASLKEFQVCVKRINQIFDHPEEVSGQVQKGDKKAQSILTFDKVSFAYNEDKQIIKDLSFKVAKGKMVAFVGSSGAGKSSLFKLITKLYSYDKGSIKFMGRELKDWDNAELREKIAYVPQEVYLFPSSIAENIAYGKVNATQAEIEKAAKLAQAHDFIMNLPDGYATKVGERGLKLSGGQKQRLAIARAILKDAPVLLLDEMTSALDVESEQLLQKALEGYAKNKTVLIIAHRLSTIINADEIFVLDAGKVVETGNHSSLIAKHGVYSKLYMKQVGGEKEEVGGEACV